MPLAKFKQTQHGSSIASQPRGNVGVVDTGKATRDIKHLQTMETQKANKEEQMYLQNMKLGMNQGKMSEISYYNGLADYYENKLSVTRDPLENIQMQNRVYQYREAAQNAAESANAKARSAAYKAAKADYYEARSAISDVEEEIKFKFKYGGYGSTSEYLDDVKKAYEMKVSMYQEVLDSDALDSYHDSAMNSLDTLQDSVRDNFSKTELYGGLEMQLNHKDELVAVQVQTGDDAGKVLLKRMPELQGKDSNGDWVKGEDNIWRKAEYLGQVNHVGNLEYYDPATHEMKEVAPGTPEYSEYWDKKAIVMYDPETLQGETFLKREDGKWQGVGDKSDVVVDKPKFNAQPAFKPEPYVNERWRQQELSVAGSPLYNMYQEMGDKALTDPYDVAEANKKNQDISVPEFKKPEFKRERAADGGWNFYKDNSPIGIDEYSKETGIERDKALAGSTNPQDKPLNFLEKASRAAVGGFGSFKKTFNKFIYRQ